MSTIDESVCSRENEEEAGSLSVIFRTVFNMGKLHIKEQQLYKRTARIKRKDDRKEEINKIYKNICRAKQCIQ